MSQDLHEELDLNPDSSLEMELEDSAPQGVNWMILVGLLVAVVGITFLVLDGMDSETYFFTVDQAVERGDKLSGKVVRVKGIVEPGTIVGKDGELERTFRISENGKSLTVSYNRAMPDTFDENMEVVVQGLVADDLSITADEVLVKCPSRYEGAPPTATEKNPQAAL